MPRTERERPYLSSLASRLSSLPLVFRLSSVKSTRFALVLRESGDLPAGERSTGVRRSNHTPRLGIPMLRTLAPRLLALSVSFCALAALAAFGSQGHHAAALTNCSAINVDLDGEETAFLGLINNYRAQNG